VFETLYVAGVKALAVLLLLALAVPSPTSAVSSSAVIREPGAIYLEDLVPRPIRLTVAADAPIYYQAGMGRFLGILRKGQQVELQAIGLDEHAYRVRGQAQQGQVAGWVEPKFLAPLKREFLDNLKQNAARQQDVQALIARNEIAINMTPEEVITSLGKPGRKTSRLDANGRQDVWEFVRYERVPQQIQSYDLAGRLVLNTIYVKVPAGKLSVVFERNLVVSMEQSEGSLDRDARVKIVTAPLAFSF
jgi:hypothetical protein